MIQKLKIAHKVLILLMALGFVGYVCMLKPGGLQAKTIHHKNTNQMITLTSYLLLDGKCKQAMEFYQSCFGGELTMTTVEESPMKDFFPPSMHSKIVNARLVSGNITISSSDWLRPQQTLVQGNTVCLYLSGGTYKELKSCFEKLSAGAAITDPLKEEPFGMYGALNDRFGIRWMFHAKEEN